MHLHWLLQDGSLHQSTWIGYTHIPDISHPSTVSHALHTNIIYYVNPYGKGYTVVMNYELRITSYELRITSYGDTALNFEQFVIRN